MPIRREIELLASYCKGVGLNIGCGDIQIRNSIGVDVSHTKAAMVIADAMDLPFSHEKLDYIIAAACFEHLDAAPITVLRHWLKFLKPSGTIAILVPDATYGIWSMTGDTGQPGKLIKPRREMEHLHAFTTESLAMLFEFAGMTIITMEVIDRQPERKERTILCAGIKNDTYSI